VPFCPFENFFKWLGTETGGVGSIDFIFGLLVYVSIFVSCHFKGNGMLFFVVDAILFAIATEPDGSE
jgi:hypothetical protein